MIGLDGSILQLVNGAFVLLSFFLSRIIWGTWLQMWWYFDIWHVYQVQQVGVLPDREHLPTWLLLAHFLSGVVLQILNYMWFCKIVQTMYRRIATQRPGKK
jgi:hypothetical protein